MTRRTLAELLMLACALLFRPTTVKAADAKDVFGPTKVWAFHLEIPAAEYEAMQPPPPAFGPPGAAPAQPAPKGKHGSERNLFNVDFPWAQADFQAEGKTYKNVGVRYSGEITYFVSS